MPIIEADLQWIVNARSDLSLGKPISFQEMDAYIRDVPGVDRHRFKVLLRTLDIELLKGD